MKFRSIEDKKMFLLELEQIELLPEVSEDWKPTEDLMELFIKKRSTLVGGLKNFRQSQNAKQSWRHNRYKIMRGIKKFHGSTKGKQFHRSLGRFLATRFTGGSLFKRDKPDEAHTGDIHLELVETLKSLASLRTHVYIEFEYFMPLSEHVEFLQFTDEVLESVLVMEKQLLRWDSEFSEENLDILARAVDEKILIDEIVRVKTSITNYDFAVEKFNTEVEQQTRSYPEILKDL